MTSNILRMWHLFLEKDISGRGATHWSIHSGYTSAWASVEGSSLIVTTRVVKF